MTEAEYQQYCYKKSIERDPMFPFTYVGYGGLLRKEPPHPKRRKLGLLLEDIPHMREEALAIASWFRDGVFRNVDDFNNSWGKSYNNIGSLLGKAKRHNESEKMHRRALDIQPEDARTHWNLHIALEEQEQLPEALAELFRAQELGLEPFKMEWINVLRKKVQKQRDKELGRDGLYKWGFEIDKESGMVTSVHKGKQAYEKALVAGDNCLVWEGDDGTKVAGDLDAVITELRRGVPGALTVRRRVSVSTPIRDTNE